MMETGLLMLRCLAVTHDYDGDVSVNVTVSSCDPRL